MVEVGLSVKWVPGWSAIMAWATGTIDDYKEAPMLFSATVKGEIVKPGGQGPIPTYEITSHSNLYRVYPEHAMVVWDIDEPGFVAFRGVDETLPQNSDWTITAQGGPLPAVFRVLNRWTINFGPNSDVQIEKGGVYRIDAPRGKRKFEHNFSFSQEPAIAEITMPRNQQKRVKRFDSN